MGLDKDQVNGSTVSGSTRKTRSGSSLKAANTTQINNDQSKDDQQLRKQEVLDSVLRFKSFSIDVNKHSKVLTTFGVIFAAILLGQRLLITLNFSRYTLQPIAQAGNFTLATIGEHIPEARFHQVPCFEKGYHIERDIYESPPINCGTVVTDGLITKSEARRLKEIAIRTIAYLGKESYQRPEIMNLRWINCDSLIREAALYGFFSETDFELFTNTSQKVHRLVQESFGFQHLYFSHICQFTKVSGLYEFSEFNHVDKVRISSLAATSIIWLSNYDEEFTGGRLVFLNGDANYSQVTLEPKFARFATWTAGFENPHGVEKVDEGERYALIMAFTASPISGFDSMLDMRHTMTTTDTCTYDTV